MSHVLCKYWSCCQHVVNDTQVNGSRITCMSHDSRGCSIFEHIAVDVQVTVYFMCMRVYLFLSRSLSLPLFLWYPLPLHVLPLTHIHSLTLAIKDSSHFLTFFSLYVCTYIRTHKHTYPHVDTNTPFLKLTHMYK